jgi:hypothetical protein
MASFPPVCAAVWGESLAITAAILSTQGCYLAARSAAHYVVAMAKRETRTYQDRREYLIQAVSNRRRKLRELAIQYKGSCCALCGYNRCAEALEFHHLDPAKKDFTISDRGYSQSWEKIKNELDKCVMLCANCHREVHANKLVLASSPAPSSEKPV